MIEKTFNPDHFIFTPLLLCLLFSTTSSPSALRGRGVSSVMATTQKSWWWMPPAWRSCTRWCLKSLLTGLALWASSDPTAHKVRVSLRFTALNVSLQTALHKTSSLWTSSCLYLWISYVLSLCRGHGCGGVSDGHPEGLDHNTWGQQNAGTPPYRCLLKRASGFSYTIVNEAVNKVKKKTQTSPVLLRLEYHRLYTKDRFGQLDVTHWFLDSFKKVPAFSGGQA